MAKIGQLRFDSNLAAVGENGYVSQLREDTNRQFVFNSSLNQYNWNFLNNENDMNFNIGNTYQIIIQMPRRQMQNGENIPDIYELFIENTEKNLTLKIGTISISPKINNEDSNYKSYSFCIQPKYNFNKIYIQSKSIAHLGFGHIFVQGTDGKAICSTYTLNNMINGKKLSKLGLHSNQQINFCVNGEAITTGTNGLYQFSHKQVPITFVGFPIVTGFTPYFVMDYQYQEVIN